MLLQVDVIKSAVIYLWNIAFNFIWTFEVANKSTDVVLLMSIDYGSINFKYFY